MLPIQLLEDQVEFVFLTFEGPDPYSTAGGLGVRISNLSANLAIAGYKCHLIYIGCPNQPNQEVRYNGNLHLYRWCQWISRYHPAGVYDGEEEKLRDFNRTVPPFIVEQIAKPAAANTRHLVVLAEEWHTGDALIQLSDLLHNAGIRQYATLLWNANNTKGFERVDWMRLNFVAAITTVSRYMKQIMRNYGVDPLVTPNGIPSDYLEPPLEPAVNHVRDQIKPNDEVLLLKVARYDPDKCWLPAVEAASILKANGQKVRFLCRGGIEAHGQEVLQFASDIGLTVKDVIGQPKTWEEVLEAILEAGPAELYNLKFNMTQSILRVFYAAADFVLANSKHEPFGLVGLEAMAVGGVVFTGPTGEAYSVDGVGAIALDTEQASELALLIDNLQANPEKMQMIRQAAPYTAARYTWEKVVDILFEKIYLASCQQDVKPFQSTFLTLPQPIQNDIIYDTYSMPGSGVAVPAA